MTHPVPGHSAPAVGFEVPLEMLSACHSRIERQCATLERLIDHVARHGVDEQAKAAAAAVMRYFDVAAADHHLDEEEDLFPALLESVAGSDPVCLRELTTALTNEHRELEARWQQRIRPMLVQLSAGASSLHGDEIRGWIRLYEHHVSREERELLPMAARLLSDAELERIGRAMRERRGIPLVL